MIAIRSYSLRPLPNPSRHDPAEHRKDPLFTIANQVPTRARAEVVLLPERLHAALEVPAGALPSPKERRHIDDVVGWLRRLVALGAMPRGVPLEELVAGRAQQIVLALDVEAGGFASYGDDLHSGNSN